MGDGVTGSATERFFAQLKAAKDYDPVAAMPAALVVSSDSALWLGAEATGNPSRLGLLLDCPARSLGVALQVIPAGEATDMQRHPHESLHCVIEGEGYSEIGGRAVPWQDGDFIYTPPWVWHRHYCNEGRDARIILVENSPQLESLGLAQRETAGSISYDQLDEEQLRY